MDKGIEKYDPTRPKEVHRANGRPGDKPTWSSGAKTMVGTTASARSRIWYTVANGTINEIYFPDIDQANTRSLRFLVSDGKRFFSDEQWDANHTVNWLAPGVPGCHIQSNCKAGRYKIVKDIITDPMRDTLMMRVNFNSSDPNLGLYLFLEPQMGDRGRENTAWVGRYKGMQMLFAQREQTNLAAAVDPMPIQLNCGYVGRSDGCTELSTFKELSQANLADDGNIALTAKVDYHINDGTFTLSLAFGSTPAEAAQQARAGLLNDFDKTVALFQKEWEQRQASYTNVEDLSGSKLDMYRVSTAVLETHQSKRFPGAFVASLSLPWGFARSDKDVGGYHVLWPRDLCETAMGKLASGDSRSARATLFYLSCTQDEWGGWSQNMWLDGNQHLTAIQMDAIALPILLADRLRKEKALDGYDVSPMVGRAAGFLLRNGAVSQQGRWESAAGYSVYTLATEIAALLAAADLLESAGDRTAAEFLRDTADSWHDSIDEWTYVCDTALAKKHAVSGYYMRVTPPSIIEHKEVGQLRVSMPNHPAGSRTSRAVDIVSPDVLSLVRFGLRTADDPRILNTVKVIDATLKHETATGPGWIRSTHDGYGEKKDGSPFDKTGIGRVWPLLAGERAHYEIAAGNYDFALELLRTIARQTSEAGMIPEQVWDAGDIPKRSLFNGHPSGSGMPLVWAHSEYIKLLRSLHGGAIWDLPSQPVERYLKQGKTADFQIWTTNQRRAWIRQGKNLRVDLEKRAKVEWTSGEEKCCLSTYDTGFGLHTVTLPVKSITPGSTIEVKITSEEVERRVKSDSFTVRIHI